MNVTGMLAIGNGEKCPFCSKKSKKRVFVASVKNNFVAHCVECHPEKFAQAIFGMPDEINDPDDGSWENR